MKVRREILYFLAVFYIVLEKKLELIVGTSTIFVILLRIYGVKFGVLLLCNQRAQTDGFAEQNGRDAERADLTCRY